MNSRRATEETLSLSDVEQITGIGSFYIRRAMGEGLVRSEESPDGVRFSKGEIGLWRAKPPELAQRLRANREKHFIRKAGYVSRNNYILPFRGTWLVGGSHLKHCTRYAWDFLVVAPSDYGKCHSGMSEEDVLALKLRRDGNHNPRDFLCHGLEIVAPADGVILEVPDPGWFVNDNEDGQGTVTIDHGNGEYSHLGHVLGRSIPVRKGDRVSQGQVICLAGGKHGDGTHQVPHLHWDIWDHPHFLFAKGIPMLISDAFVYKKGQFVRRRAFYLRAGMLVSNERDE